MRLSSNTAKSCIDYARSVMIEKEKPSTGITIFENQQFGAIRVTADSDGNPIFCLADVCRALELTNPAMVKSRLSARGISIADTLTAGGIQSMTYITEANLYKCIFQSRKPDAEKFQDWVYEDVLPSIRKTGKYAISTPQTYAQALRQLADEVEAKERAQLLLAEKTEQLDESKDWFSIKRWAKQHHKNWRDYSWRKLKAVSHELGYDVKKAFDSNFEQVNIYHKTVFEAVYGK